MKVAVALLLAGFLVAGTAIAASLLLPACGVDTGFGHRWFNFCTAPEVLNARRLALLVEEQNDDLQREVARLERELSAMQCTARYETPIVPEVAEAPAETPPEFDADAWRRGDLAVLNGCWELDSDYRVENLQTGEMTHYTQWRMCFAADGQGTEEMLATNGVTCNGPVQGSFDTTGRLIITEPDNLVCSNRTFIYQRTVSCTLDDTGRRNCSVHQPEINRTSQVQIRPTRGDQ